MILAGDIGGTKTLLGLFEDDDGQLRCIKKQYFLSAEAADFSELLAVFLRQQSVDRVCLGVAGPIVDGDSVAINLPWALTSKAVAEQTGAGSVRLLNDLQATAWGILHLPDHDFVELNPDARPQPGNIAVLAAGTGLGEAIIHWDGAEHRVIASEGGHADFAPRNDLEIELLKFLLGQYPAHVSYERVVSGQGLANIYRFLKETGFLAASGEIEARFRQGDAATAIGEAALNGEDPLCAKALEMFCSIYGAESSNLALKALSYGGVVLAGGIAAKILPLLRQGQFMRAFLDKGRYLTVLRQMSVKVCLNQEAALLGAGWYGQYR